MIRTPLSLHRRIGATRHRAVELMRTAVFEVHRRVVGGTAVALFDFRPGTVMALPLGEGSFTHECGFKM